MGQSLNLWLFFEKRLQEMLVDIEKSLRCGSRMEGQSGWEVLVVKGDL